MSDLENQTFAMTVVAKLDKVEIPTYPLGQPEALPLFFEKRVYQGSNGKVYPLPFVDKVYDDPVAMPYAMATLENEYVYLEMLPEIGGRIFKGQDKTNGHYDFFYRQDCIKPALVGLAGPWISGGVEFNWPQHHRPGTYMPCDVFIESEEDGAKTVWMSELDPITRMKGMHGVRLRPGSSVVELRVRLYNATPLTQTFLWWANVAAKVHDQYESFFPPDVTYVADHAVRAMSSFPIANNDYYGVDYGNREGANDLRRYRNIPVPTSYMVCETAYSFFGGYDHRARGGFVHVANRHIAPGKKQWTWGNHDFGWAWDRELTERGGPYVELMAGVYTDNQPDFSYLRPYETKTFSQFWWPLKEIGPVQLANEKAALRIVSDEQGHCEIGVGVSEVVREGRILFTCKDALLVEKRLDLGPGEPWKAKVPLGRGNSTESDCELTLLDRSGSIIARYRPPVVDPERRSRPLAVEPAAPEEIGTSEELYLVGEHLKLYRHPTRPPESYWHEGLRRDRSDSRCNLALGKQALERGDFDKAEIHLKRSIKRLTSFHPNPETGEAHYNLGIVSLYQNSKDAAYDLLAKAAWNWEWRSAAYCELAFLDLFRGDFASAAKHAKESLAAGQDNGKVVVLLSLSLSKGGNLPEARRVLEDWLKVDPLDVWARCELDYLLEGSFASIGTAIRNDAQTILDVVFDYAKCGLWEQALGLLDRHDSQAIPTASVPNPLSASPMIGYARAWLLEQLGRGADCDREMERTASLSFDYFFPSRLQEQVILEWALRKAPDALAAYGLGNFLYDKQRHFEAIQAWEESVEKRRNAAAPFRNLGIAYWNASGDKGKARQAYEAALLIEPDNARLIFEYDQLRKKLGDAKEDRLTFLESSLDIVLQRDDATIEYATLLNENGKHSQALEILGSKTFHPWEGGEGKALKQFRDAKISIGKQHLKEERGADALSCFEAALKAPRNLGEAYHPLQARAEIDYWRGRALACIGQMELAEQAFQSSANEEGDFQEMSVTMYSENTYYGGLSLLELGRLDEAREIFEKLMAHAEETMTMEAKIDYFATSLPDLLVFTEPPEVARNRRLNELKRLAKDGLKQVEARRKTK